MCLVNSGQKTLMDEASMPVIQTFLFWAVICFPTVDFLDNTFRFRAGTENEEKRGKKIKRFYQNIIQKNPKKEKRTAVTHRQCLLPRDIQW